MAHDLCSAMQSTDVAWAAQVHRFKAKSALLRAKATELSDRRARLEERQAALAEKHGGSKVKGTDKLKLNVGGTRVTVRRETLTQLPGTRLAALFSGRWEDCLLRDKKRRIFLDVNPRLFQKIVDFHNSMKIAPPDDPVELPDVAAEDQATFRRLCDFFGLTETCGPPPGAPDSAILQDAAHVQALQRWLREDGVEGQMELLYRASRDGWDSTQFHAHCDAQGPTVTVIQSTGGYVFGGYADQPWMSSGKWISSTGAFLFALRCHSGLPPTKMPLIPGRHGAALYGHSSRGPVFGGNDLHVGSNANAGAGSDCKVGGTYACPAGVNGRSFLTGGQAFQPVELEVFRLRATVEAGVGSEAEGGPSADWQTVAFDGFAPEVKEALEAEREALCVAEAQVVDLEEKFGQEEAFVAFFAGGEAEDIIDLDVSGARMAVRRSTLRLCAESVLARQFDAAVWTEQVDSDDSDEEEAGVMVEHSAYCFEKIVDQLRLRAIMRPGDPLPPAPVVAEHEQKNFLRVVQFFFPGSEDFILTTCAVDTVVLSAEQQQQVCAWLGRPGPRMELLYRASRDGWDSTQFHAHCDAQGPTVTVIQSTGGYVFGGYADQPWSSDGNFISSTGAFLFALHCHSGLPPTKMPLIPGRHGTALYGHSSCGPRFGSNDLHVGSNANAGAGSGYNLGNFYVCPPGQEGNTFLTGEPAFQAMEVEVFQVASGPNGYVG